MVRDQPTAWLEPGVVLTLATRIVTLLAAAISLYIVTTRRSAVEQGFYFVFTNAFAVTQLLELGAGSLIVQHAGHAATRSLRGDGLGVREPDDRNARFATLLRQGLRWYATASVLLLASLLPWGLRAFRAAGSAAGLSFAASWTALILCAAAYLPLIPFVCTLEGAGGFVPVQRMRLVQALFASVALVAGMPLAGPLRALVAMAGVSVAVPAAWLAVAHPDLIRVAFRSSTGDSGARPLGAEQWRTAGTWTALWLAPQSITALLLAHSVGAAAGRIGFGVALALVPATLCVAWLQGRYPRYAALAAAGRLDALDALAGRATAEALLAGVAGAVGATAIAAVLRALAWSRIANRVPTPWVVAGLAAAGLAWVAVQSMTAYLRAFRREPLLSFVASGVAIVIAATAIATLHLPPDGVVIVHVGATLGFALPLVTLAFIRARRRLLST